MTPTFRGLCVALAVALPTAAPAATFLVSADTVDPAVRQGFDPSQDQYLLDLEDFPVLGPLSFFNGSAGNPGIAGIEDDPMTIASDVNVVVLQNFDNNDTDDNDPSNGEGFPANWDNSFNARAALEVIAANTTEDRPGFFLYWNEILGINRLAYTENLNDGTAGLQILFANAAPGAPIGADLTDGGGNPNLAADRAAANAAFLDLPNYTADNFGVAPVPLPAALPLAAAGLAVLGGLRLSRRKA